MEIPSDRLGLLENHLQGLQVWDDFVRWTQTGNGVWMMMMTTMRTTAKWSSSHRKPNWKLNRFSPDENTPDHAISNKNTSDNVISNQMRRSHSLTTFPSDQQPVPEHLFPSDVSSLHPFLLFLLKLFIGIIWPLLCLFFKSLTEVLEELAWPAHWFPPTLGFCASRAANLGVSWRDTTKPWKWRWIWWDMARDAGGCVNRPAISRRQSLYREKSVVWEN